MRSSWVIFVVLLAAVGAQVAWYYPQLPERVASHFDATGQANAFMPKAAFIRVQLGVIALLAAIFLVLPALIVRLPASMINLPNKDYWLAPERRAATGRMLQGFLVGFGNAMLLFLLVVFGDAMRASLSAVPRLPMRIWVMLGLLILFSIVWSARMMRAFRRRE